MTALIWVILMFLLYGNYKKDLEKENNIEIKEDTEYKQKWEKSKDKEDFFTLWAHQIKTPIAALNLLLQSDNPDIYECKQESFKIESYVEMALNFLRYDSMGNDLLLESYMLEDIIKGCVKKFSTVFIHKHLSVKLENLKFNVITDDKWLSFVFEQILSNALKYTNEGSITISAENIGEEIVISISDTGIGIRSEDIPRLFEKGFTGFNGRMDKKASGLGLYLCKGICDKLGHGLSISSIEGSGTTVTVTVKKEKVNRIDLTKM